MIDLCCCQQDTEEAQTLAERRLQLQEELEMSFDEADDLESAW